MVSTDTGSEQPEAAAAVRLLQADPADLLCRGRGSRHHAAAGPPPLLPAGLLPHRQHVSLFLWKFIGVLFFLSVCL